MSGWKSGDRELLQKMVEALEFVALPLDMPGARDLNHRRMKLLTQLKYRIIPRLEKGNTPAVVVMGGPSGAGKSTLINSLLGEVKTPASVLRPTTRVPVILVNPQDVAALDRHALLSLGRLEICEKMQQGIVLVDAPDFDTLEEVNRERAERLLDAADMWIFVTSANRYGDALTWNTFVQAHTRGVQMAVIASRIPQDNQHLILQELRERLALDGLDSLPLHTIADKGALEGLLTEHEVEPVRVWIESLRRQHQTEDIIRQADEGFLRDLRFNVLELAEAVEMQSNASQDLIDQVSVSAVGPMKKLVTNVRNARYGQGAPTALWLSFASSGGVLEALVTGREPRWRKSKEREERSRAIETVAQSITSALDLALRQGLVRMLHDTERKWREDIVDTRALQRQAWSQIDVEALTQATFERWHADLNALVERLLKREESQRWLDEGGALALLCVAAGGVHGASRAIAERYGDQQIVALARASLIERLEEALASVVFTFQGVLSSLNIGDGDYLRLRANDFLNRM